MTRVWDGSSHAGSDLLMLLAIADFADDEGRAYPSVTTLAAKCRMKARNANYVLTGLKASGELEIRVNEGPKGTNLYRVVLDRLGLHSVAPPPLQPAAPLQRSAPLQPVADTPAILGIKPLQPSAPEPSGTIKEPSVKKRANKSRDTDDLSDLLVNVDQQILKDWLVVRKAKKAGGLTRTVLTIFANEASKAGLGINDAMRYCCSASWAGFKASWHANREGGAGRQSNRAGRHSGFTPGTYPEATNDIPA